MKQTIEEVLKKKIFLIIFIIALTAVFEYIFIIPSKILGNIIDLIGNTENNKITILNDVKILMCLAVAIVALGIIFRVLINLVTRYFEKELQDKIFSDFLKSKLNEIQNTKNGEIMACFTSDTSNLRHFLYRILHRLFKLIFGITITIYLMREINLKFTIILSIPIIITAGIIIILRMNVEKSYKNARKELSNISEFVQESTDSIRTTKAYAEEKGQLKEFINKNKKLKESNIYFDKQDTLLSISISVCLGICYSIIILYGSYLVNINLVTIGDVVSFLGYISNLFVLIQWIPGLISSLEMSKISYNKLEKICGLGKEFKDFKANNKDTISGDLEFRNLNFKYEDNGKLILKNINLKIKEGSTLGIIGTIGSGKTTLVNLIERLYKVDKDCIFINNTDINNIDLVTLRNSVCYITQDNFLFSSTIKENIRLFKDKYEDEEIRKSAKFAEFEDDLENMKENIYTVIGERGIELSGGQKQRVVISRAFLENTNIIIFDDTFSALDNKTEEKVLKNIKKLCENKTCIIISNRISDVKDADNIIVLDDGEIIQEGRHEKLVAEKGLYKKFYTQQISGIESLD